MQHLIDTYQLEPHPEGGFYREVYRSQQVVRSPILDQERNAITHIYFLLGSGEVSRFHSVVHDEVWNFYEGAPLRLVRYDENGLRETLIGPDRGGFTSIVKGGVYQAAETTGEYSLVGCTVAPGFDFADFSFLSDNPADRERLQAAHPEYARFV